MISKRPTPDLAAFWSKGQKDLVFKHSDAAPRCDNRLIYNWLCLWKAGHVGKGVVISPDEPYKTLVEELEARGYDLTTLRFSIRKKKASG